MLKRFRTCVVTWGREKTSHLREMRRRPDDRGAATTILVGGMALVLVAAVLVFGRIAQANDMRTQAQTGADAAALGALAPLRDVAVDLALTGIDPSAAGYWSVPTLPEAAADRYAERNDTTLVGKVHLTGLLGNTAKADVETKSCQLKEENELTAKEREDLNAGRDLCTDSTGKKGIGRHGNATAIAKLIMPTCYFTYSGVGATGELICDGVKTWPGGDRDRVIRLFKSRLVDEEDPLSYTGLPFADGPPGFHPGPNPPSNLPFGEAVVAWALKWLGTPYAWGGGNASGPSRGICCSPGGYNGANTVGFDCSGLTLYAVYQASKGRIALGHFTGNQFADSRGVHVTEDQLEPGDLVFFGSDLHHVGIYAGNGQFVEAPQTGDVVKVSPLAGRDFVGGVRFGTK